MDDGLLRHSQHSGYMRHLVTAYFSILLSIFRIIFSFLAVLPSRCLSTDSYFSCLIVPVWVFSEAITLILCLMLFWRVIGFWISFVLARTFIFTVFAIFSKAGLFNISIFLLNDRVRFGGLLLIGIVEVDVGFVMVLEIVGFGIAMGVVVWLCWRRFRIFILLYLNFLISYYYTLLWLQRFATVFLSFLPL